MATWSEVTGIMRGLRAAVREPGARRWRLADRLLAWERPLRKSDLEALGDSAPRGDILGVRVPLEIKEALLASRQKPYFTTPHFDGYPAILVHLPVISSAQLRKLLTSACNEQQRTPARRRRRSG